MSMSREERAEHCRRIASSGGRKTVETHGTSHMSQIGKLGFRAALESIGGVELYRILGTSYERKFGRSLDVTTCRNALAASQRAACRRQHPTMGGCEWILTDEDGEHAGLCGALAEHRHHIERLRGGNERENLAFFCADHHRSAHRIETARNRAGK